MNVYSPLTNTIVPATFIANYWVISHNKPVVSIYPLNNTLTIVFSDVSLDLGQLDTEPQQVFTNLVSVQTDTVDFACALILTFSDTDMQTHFQEASKLLQHLGISNVQPH